MKTRTITTTTRGLARGLGCAVALFAFTALEASDFEHGARRLMRLAHPSPTPGTSISAPISCEKCKDTVVERRLTTFSGGMALLAGGAPTQKVMKHQCGGCSTRLSVVGHGKAKAEVAKHTCTTCGSETEGCCSATRI